MDMPSPRDLEYRYLAVSYQLTELLEERGRSRALETEVQLLREAVQDLPADLSAPIAQIVDEAGSLLRLRGETDDFRVRFRLLESERRDLGRLLGYSS